MERISNPSATNVRGTTSLVGMFNFQHVVGHRWHSRFIPQSA
jgi:hypothetical protein